MDVEQYDDILFESLQNYFSTLKYYGYVKDNDVSKLLILSFFEEILAGKYDVDVTEGDYNDIRVALNCLMGSNCIIPYKKYNPKQGDSIFRNWFSSTIYRRLELAEEIIALENEDFKIRESKTLLP